MTSCQGQTVSHPWSASRCALSSDSLTRGAALPDAPPHPTPGWSVPGIRRPTLFLPTLLSLPTGCACRGLMTWGLPARQMGSGTRAYPISQRCCLMAGPVKATKQVMCCFQVVVQENLMQYKRWNNSSFYSWGGAHCLQLHLLKKEVFFTPFSGLKKEKRGRVCKPIIFLHASLFFIQG